MVPLLALLLGMWGCDPETIKPDPPAGMTLFGGEKTESGYGLLETADGGLLMVGSSRSWSDEEDHDIYLAKTNSNGALEWERTYPAILDNAGNRIIATQDGGYLIAGISGSTRNSVFTAYMLKLDAQFEQEWVISHANDAGGIGNVQSVSSVYQTADGGYFLELVYYGNLEVIKTDPQGNLTSRTNFNSWSYSQSRTQFLTASQSGGFFLATSDYNSDGSLYRFDGNGNQLYATNFIMPNQNTPIQMVKELGTNEILVVYGDFVRNNFFIMDSAGVYADTYELPIAVVTDVVKLDGGNIAMVGALQNQNYGGFSDNVQIIKVSQSGNVQGTAVFDGEGSEKANQILEKSDGRVAVIGHTDSYKGNGGTDLALILTDF